MNLKIRLYIENEKKETFMGIGVLWLLKGIEKNGSIRRAAQDMNMSYTKACQILKKLETSLDKIILERQKGGNSRMGTSLTEYGVNFLHAYEHLNKNVEDLCQLEYSQFLKKLDKGPF